MATAPDSDSSTDEPTEINQILEDVDALEDAAALAEEIVEADLSEASDDELAGLVATLKQLEDVAESARKKGVEDELAERVEIGETVGSVTRVQGHSKYVTDEEAAINCLREAGADPMEAMEVKAQLLANIAEEVGLDPDDFIGRSAYSYFRRV